MNGITLLRFVYIFALVNVTSIVASQRVLEYYIPEGYSGWVSIIYNIESAQPIERKNGKISETYIILIPEAGILMTSSNLSDIGIHRTRYYWYSDDTTTQFRERVVSANEGEVKVRIYCESGNSAQQKFYVFDRLVSLNDPATQRTCETRP